MNFNEMLQALREGKKVVRESWSFEDGYLILMPGMPSIWKILVTPSANAGNHLFLIDEFDATDWKVIDAFENPAVHESSAEIEQ